MSGLEFAGSSVDTNGSFTLSWSATSYASTYEIQRSINGGTWSTRQNTSSLSHAQTGAGNGSYAYRVRACNPVGCSAYSGTRTVTVELPPATPTITAFSVSDSGIYPVSWSSVSGATRYELMERVGSSGAWTLSYNGSYTSKNFIREVGTYYYKVRACKTYACSGYSSIADVRVTGEDDCTPMLAPGEEGGSEATVPAGQEGKTSSDESGNPDGGVSPSIIC